MAFNSSSTQRVFFLKNHVAAKAASAGPNYQVNIVVTSLAVAAKPALRKRRILNAFGG